MEVVIPQSKEAFGRYFQFLDIAREAATTYGNTATVLEPSMVKDKSAVDEFNRWYSHDSPNPEYFERWCFVQWILLAQFMRETNRDVVFKIDSDVLVFFNAGLFWHYQGCPSASEPVPDSFITKQVAFDVSDYIIDTFRSGKQHERGQPGLPISDQNILNPFQQRHGRPNLSHGSRPTCVDTGLFDTWGGPQFEGHKDIWFVNGNPCWIREHGYNKMLTLHCWGRSKEKMDVIWKQSRDSLNGEPVRMTIGQ